ncbi:helix-turn-helix domain-containing protein [Brevibacillus sp. NRS-1366]|uniref:helix-turn-helix domain-containing protein n=1 Tax=Brevibacillus sp. NRS-1366 TaxID=3233899 RepID=UPI003D222339
MQMQIVLPQLELHKIESTYENAPHVHDDQFQVTIPVQGTCFFTHEGKVEKLAAGEGLILHPRDKHSFHIGPDAGVIIVRVKDRCMYAHHQDRGFDPAFRQQFDPVAWTMLFRQWTTGMLALDRTEKLAVEEIEMQVLAYLQRLLVGNAASDIVPRLERNADSHMARVLDYIHAHYTEKMSVDTLASLARQSRFHFIRSFKFVTGQTPYQYVLQLRIGKAKELLQRSSGTVTDISFVLGFSSPSQFFRIFAKHVGVTPEQYRIHTR